MTTMGYGGQDRWAQAPELLCVRRSHSHVVEKSLVDFGPEKARAGREHRGHSGQPGAQQPFSATGWTGDRLHGQLFSPAVTAPK